MERESEGGNPPRTPVPSQWMMKASAITVTRLCYDKDDLPIAPSSKRDEAVSVITQLTDFRMHRLWKNNELIFEGGHPKGAIAITDLRNEWQCHHLSPFDNLRFNIPLSFVRSFLEDIGRPQFDGFDCRPGTRDDVILGLAQAVLPYLVNRHEANQLFFEQISLVLLTHLTHTYASQYFPTSRNGVLAPWQEKRVLEFLTANAFRQVSITELAELCNLSRSYFNRAFKETFGRTPYRWVMEYRISKAKDLLLADFSIQEVATTCGFADQSHLTRVFSDIAGEPPGNWRRQNRLKLGDKTP
ncbi:MULTISPECIES: AraC family transcriptional regulator [unclassified Rhizobium]|uniref:helix-turn-helix domain-containing protein n=1 Tax=unclassified Rhizobium TaxID=2613769 RepID=UPI000EA86D0B|nr:MULTISPECIES: AraC family transcriptional regulator [unclassified Rhizobium]AYG64621.1 AraC family transcriptional regulator [Rhizobium sp. CCGE531]AYG71103.1 AraC family transcriptional regulator [Rhizobium sp. CCGE532]